MDEKLKRTLKCMIIGISIYNVILLIVSIIIFIIILHNKDNIINAILKNEIGLVVGYIVSIIGVYSMAKSIVKVTSKNDDDFAKKYMTLMSTVRFIIFVVILVVIINKNVIGIEAGALYILLVFGIKIGAYLAPMIERSIYR